MVLVQHDGEQVPLVRYFELLPLRYGSVAGRVGNISPSQGANPQFEKLLSDDRSAHRPPPTLAAGHRASPIPRNHSSVAVGAKVIGRCVAGRESGAGPAYDAASWVGALGDERIVGDLRVETQIAFQRGSQRREGKV